MSDVKLKPCPFCGGECYIERMGTGRVSMQYQCGECGCSLETGETWLDDNCRWNERSGDGAKSTPLRNGDLFISKFTNSNDFAKALSELSRERVEYNYSEDVLCMEEDNAELKARIVELEGALLEISNMCIGNLTMSYSLDADHIGQLIYEATGKINPELNEALKDKS